ncbi:MAG: NAD(P)-binding domain-containing protein [Clostridia bacterium]|jgi:6-phosphogluconate dehydrogenase (decarboxylating)|nr:NAD(P)-binding domain-containing protein [Clostridia bacterium]
MSVTAAVIGAGRMGSVVVKQFPESTQKIVIDRHPERAEALAAQVQGKSASSLEAAREADLIAVVLPAAAVNETVDKLTGIAKPGAIILNMATSGVVDSAVRVKNKDVRVVDAKIIGHAKSMEQGEPGLVVVKTEDEKIFELIKSQLPGYLDVVPGDADLVPKINTIGSGEGIKAAVAARKQLQALNIPEEWIHVCIRTACAGTMKSYTENDLGHFARELADKYEKEL